MATFRFDLSGNAVEQLDKLIAATSNTQPILDGMGRVLTNFIRLGFKTSRSPWGEPWQPLKYRQGQPLRDTGRFQASITHIVQSETVEIGTNIQKYPPIHQFGGVITPKVAKSLRFVVGGQVVFAKSVTIPSRPWLPITAGGMVSLPAAWEQAVINDVRAKLEQLL
ncbi:MAG: phage virion morphogenesis protein [Pseudomonadota bacterium]|nr:phage virion morphogenesis protein [Pseudomonadota bacterium]